MNPLEKAADETALILTNWGLSNVTTDPTLLALPGVLLAPTAVESATLGGSLTIEWEVWLIAPDTLTPYTHLGAMMSAVTDYMPARFEVQSITLPNLSPDPLPALTFTFTTETELP